MQEYYYVKYARVSSDEQREGISIDFQIGRIDTWVAQQAGRWICVGEFLEDASGFEYERPEMDIIWQLAKEQRINAVVVLRRNRFSRGEAASIILEQHFKKHGVRLFSVEQGEFTPGRTNRIVSAVERAQSEDEAESAKKNMREKRYAYVDAGSAPSAGHALYGYDKVGKKAALRYVINEAEAEVVRFIFDMYIQRYSFDDIAKMLSADGISQPANKMLHDGSRQRNHRYAKVGWTKWTVRRIVKNAEAYRGVMTAYKYAVREDAPEQRTINIPPIIDEDVYTKAMYLSEQTRHVFMRNPERETRPYYLTGRFACTCGYSFSGQKAAQKNRRTGEVVRYHYYYRCSSMAVPSKKHLCDMHFLPADKVENVIWDFISSILADPRAAIARYRQQQNETQKHVDNAIAHVESIDEVVAELNAEREQVLTLFRKRLISEDRLEADVAVIDRQIDKLHTERDKWVSVIELNTITDAQMHQLGGISSAIRDRLGNLDADEKSKILDRLRLKVTGARENGQVVFYVSILGALPERLELVDSTSNSDSPVRKRAIFTNALVFRVPLVIAPLA